MFMQKLFQTIHVMVLFAEIYKSNLCKIAKAWKKSVFLVTGLKILGRVGTHFFLFFFLETNIILYILSFHFAFQNAWNYIFFPQNLKKYLGFTSKIRKGRVTLNTSIFFYLALPLKRQEKCV